MARMKAKIISSLSTIMLLASLPSGFLQSMQTSSEKTMMIVILHTLIYVYHLILQIQLWRYIR